MGVESLGPDHYVFLIVRCCQKIGFQFSHKVIFFKPKIAYKYILVNLPHIKTDYYSFKNTYILFISCLGHVKLCSKLQNAVYGSPLSAIFLTLSKPL